MPKPALTSSLNSIIIKSLLSPIVGLYHVFVPRVSPVDHLIKHITWLHLLFNASCSSHCLSSKHHTNDHQQASCVSSPDPALPRFLSASQLTRTLMLALLCARVKRSLSMSGPALQFCPQDHQLAPPRLLTASCLLFRRVRLAL